MKFLDVPRSGSYQGLTSSRNRFGQYVRTRATPVNPATTFQQSVRADFTTNAQAWRLLTATQRQGWNDLGAQMVRTDSLGQSYTLTGFQAYCSLNANQLSAGNAVLSDAPALLEPADLATVTITLTAAAFSVAWTPTPLGAGERIFVYTSPQVSAGRTFMGDFRLVGVGAAASASPLAVLTGYQARFGTPIVGNRIFTNAVRYSGGFLSRPLLVSQVVA